MTAINLKMGYTIFRKEVITMKEVRELHCHACSFWVGIKHKLTKVELNVGRDKTTDFDLEETVL